MECPKKDRPTIRGAFNQYPSFKKPTIYIQKLVIWLKVLVCENNSSGTGSVFMVTDCLGKINHGD